MTISFILFRLILKRKISTFELYLINVYKKETILIIF